MRDLAPIAPRIARFPAQAALAGLRASGDQGFAWILQSDLARALRRGWRYIAVATAIALTVAAIYLARTKRLYQASTRTGRGARYMPARLALAASLLLAPITRADGPAEIITLKRCEVEFGRAALVGSATLGVLQECSVQPGDAVKKGQVLARLQDADARAEMELREAEAENDIDVRLTAARREQAQAKLRRVNALARSQASSREERELQRLDVESRTLEAEQARRNRVLSALRYRQTGTLTRLREVVCPFDGEVVAVLKFSGEPVNVNDSVVRVVQSGRLSVSGRLDVADVWRVKAGREVRVRPEVAGAELPIEVEGFEGKIIFVDREIDRATQTCRDVAEVDNRDGLLRAGMEARLDILPAEGPASASTAVRRPASP